MNNQKAFRIGVLEFFLPLLLITSLTIIIIFYSRTRESSFQLAETIVSNTTARVTENTLAFLEPAAISSRLIAGTLRPDMDYMNEPTLLRTMWEQVGHYPQILSLYIGDNQGNFLQARQAPGRVTRIIERDQNGPTEDLWIFRKDDYSIEKTLHNTTSFDPRNRPWYKAALQKNGLDWSNLYIFSSTQSPGVTASTPMPIENPKGVVVAADITLEKLSEFLHNLEVTPNTEILLFNSNGEIIASNLDIEFYSQIEEEIRPLSLKETGLEHIFRGAEKYSNEGVESFKIKNGQNYYIYATSFPEEMGWNWTIMVSIPESDIMGTIRTTLAVSLFVSFVLLLLGVIMVYYLSAQISKPLMELAYETEHIKNFHLELFTEVHSPFKEISILNESILAMNKGLSAFKRYVPAEIVRQLIQTKKEARLGGERQNLTLFFSSIKGFNQTAEGLSAETLFLHLSEYIDQVSQIIMSEKGTIDKYIQDTIMAFWGAPLPLKDHPTKAVVSALKIQNLIKTLNTRWMGEVKPVMDTRIGIHTGSVMVGNLGSRDRLNYTVLGHNVNITRKIEQYNKTFGTYVLVSQDLYDQTKDSFYYNPIENVHLEIQGESILYEPLGKKPEVLPPQTQAIWELTNKAFKEYQLNNTDKALELYRELQNYQPRKQLARYFIAKLEKSYKAL